MYQFKQTQFVKSDLKTAWEFFSAPQNLQKITPPKMGFEVKTEVPEKMYPGLIIGYKVRPLMGVPLEWVTEITHVREGEYFVDEQRVGPYKIWHHEHIFVPQKNGIEMTDIVTYLPPFGILGKMMHPLFIQPKLKEIFDHRTTVINQLFA